MRVLKSEMQQSDHPGIISKLQERLGNRQVSILLLFSSVAAVIVLPLIADYPQFSAFTGNFVLSDLYKISLFAQGQSPYVVEPWAASYPPLYFMIWTLPYLVSSYVFGSSSSFQIYLSFQVLSMFLMGCVSFLIYRTLSKTRNKNEAISLASIFLLCSVTALLSLVGDAFGLLFLASGCVFIYLKRYLWGILFISIAVAFKVHPIIGALMFLTYLLVANSKSTFSKAVLVAGIALGALAVIPMLLIPGGYDSIVGFHAGNLQMYTFNFYSGLLDTLSNLASASTDFFTDLKTSLNYGWLLVVLGSTLYLCWSVARKKYLRSANPVDLLSIGILFWLALLKQTLPHYFLWALVPLLVMGRLKSSIYLIAGEGLGLAFFALGYLFNQGPQVQYWILPGLAPSLAFFAGGISFVLFDFLAIRSLLNEIKAKPTMVKEEKIQVSLPTN